MITKYDRSLHQVQKFQEGPGYDFDSLALIFRSNPTRVSEPQMRCRTRPIVISALLVCTGRN